MLYAAGLVWLGDLLLGWRDLRAKEVEVYAHRNHIPVVVIVGALAALAGGRSSIWGLFAAVMYVVLAPWIGRKARATVSSLVFPSLPMVMALARINCYLHGCCRGSAFFGLPVQLVESGLLAVAFCLVLGLDRLSRAWCGVAAVGLVRLGLDFYREDHVGIGAFPGGLPSPQLLAAGCLLLAAIGSGARWERGGRRWERNQREESREQLAAGGRAARPAPPPSPDCGPRRLPLRVRPCGQTLTRSRGSRDPTGG